MIITMIIGHIKLLLCLDRNKCIHINWTKININLKFKTWITWKLINRWNTVLKRLHHADSVRRQFP